MDTIISRRPAQDAPSGEDDAAPVLTILQGYLANAPLPPDGRLPPERALATTLGVSRAELRKALAVLEHEGQLWRHVGRGTFLGARPIGAIGGVAALAATLDPAQVMQARLAIEPSLARLAAHGATAGRIAGLRDVLARGREIARQGRGWREFEGQDAHFHRLIAEACGNPLLLHLFDTLSAVRRAVTWGRPRSRSEGPPGDHHSFAEHDAIAAAIEAGDGDAAEAAMRAHITTVLERLGGT